MFSIIKKESRKMNNVLEINGLSKAFKDFKLNDISFNVERGCIMGFVGQNGSGKTTTIKLILNAINKDRGTVNIFGRDNLEHEVYVKAKIGYIPDQDFFMPTMTLKHYAKALKLFYDTWDDDLMKSYADRWSIPLDKKLNELSKGTKTKAMLALAFAHSPELLILDEPTAGLDPVARIEVLDLLRDFVADGQRSVLFSSHITSDLDKIADYITIINNGTILESLSIDKIEEKYVLISGALSELSGIESEFVGIRKGTTRFEGLILRERAQKLAFRFEQQVPNIENMLTFSIWGNK